MQSFPGQWTYGELETLMHDDPEFIADLYGYLAGISAQKFEDLR